MQDDGDGRVHDEIVRVEALAITRHFARAHTIAACKT
jgi:hypothetical protein